MANLLVVDDESSICWGIEKLGKQLGHEVYIAASAELGIQIARSERIDLLLLDVRLPGMDGLTAIEHFRQHLADVPIIVMTAFGDLATAVKALGAGAFEYVVKPFDLAEITAAMNRALQPTRLNEGLPGGELDGMVGQSPVMQQVFKRIALAAHSDVSVLLIGESGTGKEVAARAIHQHSSRAAQPLVAVNVAALNPSLAEAELFGHVAGAFTGAQQSRRGLLAQADGGTLFLDEVADVPLPLQAKLLRVLDQGEVLPVGADDPIKTQFRVVAATHRNLEQMIAAGEFRHDLFFRLSAFPIPLPPLRDRDDDVVRLANYFVSQFGSPDSRLATATTVELRRRPWHGNVRELRNAMEHALVLARTGPVLPTHLPTPLPHWSGEAEVAGNEAGLKQLAATFADGLLEDDSASGMIHERFIEAIEPALLKRALEHFGGEVAPAARALGLHRTTLRRKLDQYGIDPGE